MRAHTYPQSRAGPAAPQHTHVASPCRTATYPLPRRMPWPLRRCLAPSRVHELLGHRHTSLPPQPAPVERRRCRFPRGSSRALRAGASATAKVHLERALLDRCRAPLSSAPASCCLEPAKRPAAEPLHLRRRRPMATCVHAWPPCRGPPRVLSSTTACGRVRRCPASSSHHRRVRRWPGFSRPRPSRASSALEDEGKVR